MVLVGIAKGRDKIKKDVLIKKRNCPGKIGWKEFLIFFIKVVDLNLRRPNISNQPQISQADEGRNSKCQFEAPL